MAIEAVRTLFDKSSTLRYHHDMMIKTIYEYSEEKNKKLIHERHISFEEVIAALDNGQLLDVFEHPKKDKYPNQKMYVVQVNYCVYIVPFIEKDENTVFLKTVFPSRKAKKKYLNEVSYEEKKI